MPIATRIPRRTVTSRVTPSIAVVAIVAALVGCGATGTPVQPPSTPAPTAASSTPSAIPTPEPTLVPGGSATENRPYFDAVMLGLLARSTQPSSLEIADTLVAAGFPRESIEVTADTTRVGDPADSILVSVLIEGECVLGQVAGGSFGSEQAAVLGTGRCLVGRTASLD